MREVILPDGRTVTTALGFGCSALVGGRTSAESVRLLEVAFAAGIRHFDVARVYGTGDAEALVGRFAKTRRADITVTSKFGIDPLRPNASVAIAKRAVRMVTRRSRRAVRLVHRHASKLVQRGLFTAEHATASLELSLRQLGMDYLDIFLLHDCSASEWRQDDLLAALDGMVRHGEVRAVGPSSSRAEILTIGAHPDHRPRVVQYETGLLLPSVADAQAFVEPPLTVTHGCFRDALTGLTARFAADRALAVGWSRALDCDLSMPGTVPDLLLCCALTANRHGIVLFSSGDQRRIEHNARLAHEMPYEEAQLTGFANRARALLGGGAVT